MQPRASPYIVVHDSPPWQPGIWKRFPYLGIGSLIGAVLSTCAAVIVVVSSDQKPVTEFSTWNYRGHTLHIQPSTLLAISSALTNVLLGLAFSEAVTIAWWWRVLQGSTVGELHRSWSYGQSLWAALSSGSNFNIIALAAILTKIAIIDGPLLQRASSTAILPTPAVKILTVPISPGPFSAYGTGFITGHGPSTSLFSSLFTDVLQAFNSKSSIVIPNSGCEGDCELTIVAAGFDVSCTSAPVSGSLPSLMGVSGITSQIFSITIDQGYTDTYMTGGWIGRVGVNEINVTTFFKSQPGIDAGFVNHICSLRENIGKYKLQLTNNTVTSLPLPSTNVTEQLITRGTEEGHQGLLESTIGGIWLALSNRFTCSANLTAVGPVYVSRWNSSLGGSVYTEYINSSNRALASAAMTWTDPMPDILTMAHELSFRFALSSTTANVITQGININDASWIWNSGFPRTFPLNQTVQASQVKPTNIYVSHQNYLAGALGVILLSCISILPVYYGWWRLGRSFSQSPVEIAKAFNAPLLADANSNDTAATMVRILGEREVRYGITNILSSGGATGSSTSRQDKIVGMDGSAIELGPMEFERRPGNTNQKVYEQIREQDCQGSQQRLEIVGSLQSVHLPQPGDEFL